MKLKGKGISIKCDKDVIKIGIYRVREKPFSVSAWSVAFFSLFFFSQFFSGNHEPNKEAKAPTLHNRFKFPYTRSEWKNVTQKAFASCINNLALVMPLYFTCFPSVRAPPQRRLSCTIINIIDSLRTIAKGKRKKSSILPLIFQDTSSHLLCGIGSLLAKSPTPRDQPQR